MTNTPTKFSKNSQAIDIIGPRSDTEQNIASTKAIQGESVLTRSYTPRSAGDAAGTEERDKWDGRCTPLDPEDAKHDI